MELFIIQNTWIGFALMAIGVMILLKAEVMRIKRKLKRLNEEIDAKKVIKSRKFTLIELLFVIMILIILMGIAWVAGGKVLKASKIQQTKAEIAMIQAACEQFKVRWGDYPDNIRLDINSCQKCNECMSSGNDYDQCTIHMDFYDPDLLGGHDDPLDPYDLKYKYVPPTADAQLQIISAGIDGDYGTKDDITNGQ